VNFVANQFVFRIGLRRKDFRDVTRLAWAQEVRGSSHRTRHDFIELLVAVLVALGLAIADVAGPFAT
jgi:hypothetical protein